MWTEEQRKKIAAMPEVERLDFELVDALQEGDTDRVALIEHRLDQLRPRPPMPPKAPTIRHDGKTWHDIGDGWQEIRTAGSPASGRLIRGIASSSSINDHNYVVDPMGMQTELPVPLRSSHDLRGRGVGEVYLFRRNARLIYFEAEIRSSGLAEDYAWKRIEDGALRQVSLGWEGRAHTMKVAAVVEGITFYQTWPGGELSLCAKGANPDVRLEVMGADAIPWRDYVAMPGAAPEPRVPYAGVWSGERAYTKGQFVTHGGSLWHAEIDSKAVKPGDGPDVWRLSVKRGEAGKLEETP